MTYTRQVKEGTLPQGEDESIVYTLDVSPWGSSPTSIAQKLYVVEGSEQTGTYTDVSATNLAAGSATASGDIISTTAVSGLTAGLLYRLEFKFTVSGNVMEAYLKIQAEK